MATALPPSTQTPEAPAPAKGDGKLRRPEPRPRGWKFDNAERDEVLRFVSDGLFKGWGLYRLKTEINKHFSKKLHRNIDVSEVSVQKYIAEIQRRHVRGFETPPEKIAAHQYALLQKIQSDAYADGDSKIAIEAHDRIVKLLGLDKISRSAIAEKERDFFVSVVLAAIESGAPSDIAQGIIAKIESISATRGIVELGQVPPEAARAANANSLAGLIADVSAQVGAVPQDESDDAPEGLDDDEGGDL